MKPRNSRGWASATSRRHFLALSDFLCMFIATPTKYRRVTSYIILLKSWMTVLSSGVWYCGNCMVGTWWFSGFWDTRYVQTKPKHQRWNTSPKEGQTEAVPARKLARTDSGTLWCNWVCQKINRVFKKRPGLEFKTLILEFQMDTKTYQKNISS